MEVFNRTAKLWKLNVRGGRNDEQAKAVFDKYNLYPLLDGKKPASSSKIHSKAS